MTAYKRRANDCHNALWAEALPPSKGSPLADEMGVTAATETRKRPSKPILQRDTRTTAGHGMHGRFYCRISPQFLPTRLCMLLCAVRKICWATVILWR